MPGWIQRVDPETGKSVFVPKGEASNEPQAPAVVGDIPDYESPVTGEPVSGRKQRREDLKRAGAVEYEPGMKEDALRKREERWVKLDKSVEERLRWFGA